MAPKFDANLECRTVLKIIYFKNGEAFRLLRGLGGIKGT
jgi:hypothetical protein